MSTATYKGYTLDVRGSGYGGFVGLVVSSSTVVESFARDSEEAAFAACRLWADAVSSDYQSLVVSPTVSPPLTVTDASTSTFVVVENTDASSRNTGVQCIHNGLTVNLFCNTANDFIVSIAGLGSCITVDGATGDTVIDKALRPGSVTSASTFVLSHYMVIKDTGGTTYYLPVCSSVPT